jgi:hypothetical protein
LPPEVSDQLYGDVPPVAASLVEKGVPTVPFGREVVDTASELAEIVMLMPVDVAVLLAESVTLKT